MAEQPEWYYDDGPGEPQGPLTWDQLKAHAASGRIDLQALIWRGGGSGRTRAWTVKQLLAACLSDRQLQDEESYIRLGGEGEDDPDDAWDESSDDDDPDHCDWDEPVVDPEDAELASKISSAPIVVPRRTILGHEAGVTSLAFRHGARPLMLASGSRDGTVRLWDFRTGKMLACLKGHGDTIAAVAFSPSRPFLASGSRDGTVRLWNLAEGERRSATWAHGTPVTALAFSPDGKVVVSGGHDGTLRWWDVPTGAQIRCVETRATIEGLCLSPDGLTIISTHARKFVRLWEFASGQEIRVGGDGPRSVVGCNVVAGSPVGTSFAVAGNIKTFGEGSGGGLSLRMRSIGYISLCGVRTLDERRFRAHTGEAFSVAFSPDGGFLASTGADGAARVWDVADLSLYGTLSGHRSTVYAVTFSPGGRFIVTGGNDSAIHVYDMSFGYLGRGKRRPDWADAELAVADFTRAIRAGRGGHSQDRASILAEAHFERGKAHLRSGDIRRAACDYRRAIRGDENFADACRNLGDDHLNAGRLREAVACFTAVIDEARLPKSLEFFHRGWCRLRRRAYRRAIPDFTSAIRFEDDYLPIYYEYRGVAHRRLGLLDEAIEDFGRALDLYRPDESEAVVSLHARRGRAWSAKGEPGKAIRDYSAALDYRPPEKELVKILRLRGRAYHQIQEYSRAIEDFTAAFAALDEISDDERDGDSWRALLHIDRGRARVGGFEYGAAVGDFESAISLHPSDEVEAEAYCGMGEIHLQTQDFYAAIRDYSTAIRLVPDLAHAHERRAVVHWRLGQDERANQDRLRAEQLRQEGKRKNRRE